MALHRLHLRKIRRNRPQKALSAARRHFRRAGYDWSFACLTNLRSKVWYARIPRPSRNLCRVLRGTSIFAPVYTRMRVNAEDNSIVDVRHTFGDQFTDTLKKEMAMFKARYCRPLDVVTAELYPEKKV